MNYYDKELQRLQQEMMEKKRIHAKLSDLLIQESDLEKRTQELEKIMRREQKDVDRLTGKSLTAFFYKVVGQMEEKLTKEEQEAYAAAVKYNGVKSELQAVKEDIGYCQNCLLQLKDCEENYERILAKKTEQVRDLGTPEADRILQLEKCISFLRIQQKEIREAMEAGNHALLLAEQILKELNEAKGWSTADILGGGLMADFMKYDHLKKVQELIQNLQNALRGFRTELADVAGEIPGDIQVEISDFLHFADFFFDGFFTDWLVYDKIQESRNCAQQTCGQIQNVLERLEQNQESISRECSQLKEELEQTVLAL